MLAARSVLADRNKKTAVYYNLNGQQVEHPTKGIYLYRGRKVVVR